MRPLDPDAIASLPARDSCVVCAGPGTGKTRLLVKRLNFLLRSPPRPGGEVACITYTNAAADEIASRLESGVRPGFVGTIHSFLLEHIVYPYGCWVDGVPADFDLVTVGYGAPHIQWMQANDLIDAKKAHVPAVIAAFENCGYDIEGTLRTTERASLTQVEMKAFVERRLSKKQINQQDVLWLAWKVLSDPNHAHVLDALSCRFSAVLVDEFQDTSALQWGVLEKLHEKGRTALFLVGDKEQSIFSFAGASIESYEAATRKFTAYPLSKNYRSTGRIVRLLNLFLEPALKLEAAADWKDEDIPVYVFVGKVDEAVKVRAFMELRVRHGLKGGGRNPDFLVMARATAATRRLAALTKAKNDGGDDVFERLEERHRKLNAILIDLFRARRLLDLGEEARAFRSLDRGLSRLVLKANPGFGAPDSVGLTRGSWRAMVCEVLKEMRSLDTGDVVPWVGGVQGAVKNAILNAGGTKAGRKLILLGKVEGHLKKKVKYRTKDALRCVDVSNEVTSSVRTIHRAKGLEAESVLLVAERGHLTGWLNCFGSGKPRAENARIGYVGLSRAMKLLCIATDSLSPDARANLERGGVTIKDLGG